MPFGPNTFTTSAGLTRTAGFGFNHHVIRTPIISQIAFINTQEKHPITLRDEFMFGAEKDKVVIVISNYGDQASGRLSPHQPVIVSRQWEARRS